MSKDEPGYLHGFDKKEQDRLFRQARFLEESVHSGIGFPAAKKVLELGCGVGAQTKILAERNPSIQFTGVDFSQTQLDRASQELASEIKEGRVEYHQADARKLPFKDGEFDGAFLCWFLEHVQEPVEILKEVKRALKKGAPIYCTEVLNSTFFVHPYSPATQEYWFKYNDHQWELKGDPFAGAKLANYLLSAEYRNVFTRPVTYHYDNRDPESRADFIEFWTNLLLSGAPGLIEANRVTEETVNQMKVELNQLKSDPDSVFYYTWIRAQANA